MSGKIALTFNADYRTAYTQEFNLDIDEKVLKQNIPIIASITNEVMTHLAAVLNGIDAITRVAPHEPCCAAFSEWAPTQQRNGFKACPYCGTPITDQRRAKYLRSETTEGGVGE